MHLYMLFLRRYTNSLGTYEGCYVSNNNKTSVHIRELSLIVGLPTIGKMLYLLHILQHLPRIIHGNEGCVGCRDDDDRGAGYSLLVVGGGGAGDAGALK